MPANYLNPTAERGKSRLRKIDESQVIVILPELPIVVPVGPSLHLEILTYQEQHMQQNSYPLAVLWVVGVIGGSSSLLVVKRCHSFGQSVTIDRLRLLNGWTGK